MSPKELETLTNDRLLELLVARASSAVVRPDHELNQQQLSLVREEVRFRMVSRPGPATIQDDIDLYKRFGTPPLLKALFDKIIGLRCPNCHEPVPIELKT